ncbi:hypothetical protein L596_006503 [Steinernema carpocapsae]|uniref:Uncharacterized protein n=1 Tax=Steinernema carpocapsae TaxID=34508 RepID=A0A4U8VAU8_STECR|nr:hypothetical protein L596_006503 [Steinernema carpocapsae]
MAVMVSDVLRIRLVLALFAFHSPRLFAFHGCARCFRSAPLSFRRSRTPLGYVSNLFVPLRSSLDQTVSVTLIFEGMTSANRTRKTSLTVSAPSHTYLFMLDS